MVGLSQSLKELGGNDIGRFPWALHGKVFFGVCSTCKGVRVPRVKTGDDDST